jgi:hypothetical protein
VPMSIYVFKRRMWRKWKHEKKVSHMQNIVAKHSNDERCDLINHKYYFGFGYRKQHGFYINEEIDVGSNYCNTSEIRTRINVFLGYRGTVHMTKEIVPPNNKIIVLFRKSVQHLLCHNKKPILAFEIAGKTVESGTSIWKCTWVRFASKRGSSLKSIGYTLHFHCLECAFDYYIAKLPLCSTYPTRFNNTIPTLQQLSGFIVLHSHFPFVDTLLRKVLPKPIFRWLAIEFPSQMYYLRNQFAHLGICVE